MTTRSQRAEQLEALLTNALHAPTTDLDHIFRRLSISVGATDVADILGMVERDLDDTPITNSSGDPVHLTLAQKRRILFLVPFMAARDNKSWSTVTADEFNDWRVEHPSAWAVIPQPPPVPNVADIAAAVTSAVPVLTAEELTHAVTTSTTTALGAALPQASAADAFDKGSKRTIESYMTFKDRRQWNSWHRSFRATASQHDLDDILDPKFAPTAGDQAQIDLFNKKQKFAFAVFTHTLKESSTAEIVRCYSILDTASYGNAQGLYTDLIAHMQEGISATLSSEQIEEEINGMRLDKNWSKTTEAFINRMSHLFSDHQNVVDADLYPDSWYIKELQNSLNFREEFRNHFMNHKATRNQLAQITGTPVADEIYTDFLAQCLDQAKVIDDTLKQVNKQCQVNVQQSQRNSGRGRPNPGCGSGGRGGHDNTGSDTRPDDNGRDHNRGGRHPGCGRPNRNHSDYVPPSVYNNMSPAQRNQLWQAHQSRETHSTAHSTSPPSTIQVNHQQGHDTPGTTATHTSAPITPEPGTVLRHMLSNNRARTSDTSAMTTNHMDTDDTIVINGRTYRAPVTYCVHSDSNNRHATGSLMDGGSNGGLAGSDVLILETSLDQQVDVTGVTSDTLKHLPIFQAAGIVDTHDEGPIICIMSQYAQRPTGKSIHSKGQFEHFGCIVHDTPISKGGYQCIVTPEGYVIPLHVRDGLHYMDMRPPTPHELETFPHVFLTDDSQWNPSILDDEFHDTNALPPDPAIISRRDSRDPRVNDTGSINHIRQIDELHFFDLLDHLPPELTFLERIANALLAFPQRLHRHFCDLDLLKPHFGWVSADRIQRTLEHTTQFYRASNHFPFRRHFKSRFPAANVRRLPEWYSTDTIFSDVPAADDGIPGHGGCTMAQLYGGIDSHF